MAEVKNTFIQSKMNQDLDGRILPNGQYRYGKNIQISRSEGDDVGALENVLGTELLTSFGLTDCAYEIIGYTLDIVNDLVYVFITDYSDASDNQLDNNITGQNNAFGFVDKNCFIGVYNDRTGLGKLMVGGDFLNFSKTHPITGVNLVEDLLFWTDNRNQPRKINVKTAQLTPFVLGGSTGYYINEDTISVAKYYPFECISLLKNIGGPDQWVSTMTNKTEQWLPSYCVAKVDVDAVVSNTIVLNGVYNNIIVAPGEPLLSISGVNVTNNIATGAIPTVTSVTPDTPVGKTTIVVSVQQSIDADDLIYFHAESPDFDVSWPGDETFLTDKFVRFSYRFEFDDGEYSLMAPFTQACFVPKQDGYFIGKDVESIDPPMNTTPATVAPAVPSIPWEVSSTLIGDEGKAYSSSIVEFFENKIQDIGLYIPAPYKNNTQSTFDNVQDEFKIKNIDIIYKESESTTAYVLDTISADGLSGFNNETSSFYSYDYQSRKPWRTLPGNEITRVYDKVPIRALAQESSGNRIIYGNYVDKHTSPDSLSYVVGIDAKPDVPVSGDTTFGDKNYYIQKEYQNHTVKQNRTYQVGIVLSDRYGRQSDVILSEIFDEAIQGYGSTIYHPYRTTQMGLIDSTDTWPGDQINIVWHQIIPEAISPNKKGYPGLYKNNNETLVGFEFLSDWTGIVNTAVAPDTCCIDFVATQFLPVLATAEFTICADSAGNAIPGSLQINSSTGGWREGSTVSISAGASLAPCWTGAIGTYDLKSKTLVDQNTLGWYSWKVVVKQSEQDYYNCYLPGVLAGYPKDLRSVVATDISATSAVLFPKGDNAKTAHIVLLNDNINKIPRDLSEVGPTQNVFGSSVKLYGRVENYKTPSDYYTYNRQFDPETLPDTVVNIGNITDLNLGDKVQAGTENSQVAPLSYPQSTSILMPVNFYNGITNPLVAEISTRKKIGWSANDSGVDGSIDLGMFPYLSVYETSPVLSDLDIYWETSTSGLISDLNYNIINVDNTVPCGITDPSINWSEADAPNTIISGLFSAVSCSGVELDLLIQETTVTLVSVINNLGISTNEIILEQPNLLINQYQLRLKNNPWQEFLAWNLDSRRTWNITLQIDRPASPLTQAYSSQITITTQVENATPNQTGMFDLAGGNDARSDLKIAVFDQVGQYLNVDSECLPSAPITPNFVIVGDWQTDSVSYSSNPDNNYYSTFGRNYIPSGDFICDLLRHPNGDGGYGPYDIGAMDYRPYFSTLELPPWYPNGYNTFSSNAPAPNFARFVNRNITMLKKPGTGGVGPWDGIFESWNGAYGTQPGYTYPPNPNRAEELVYTVIRAYQVSAFFPYQTDVFDRTDCSDRDKVAKYGIAECVFAADGGGNPIPLVSGLPQMGSGEIQVTFDGWVGAATAPAGPIYWDFNNPLSNNTDPADVNTGGEADVLTLYPQPGQSHYWQDLSDCVDAGDSSLLTLWTPGPGVKPMVGNTSRAGFWFISNVLTTSDPDPLEHHVKVKLEIAQARNPNQTEIPKFWMDNSISTPAFDNPAKAILKTDPNTPMPPGRYVVTVRVTDRSINTPSGNGLYFEWDVPVTINGPFATNVGTFFTYKDPSIGGPQPDSCTWDFNQQYNSTSRLPWNVPDYVSGI